MSEIYIKWDKIRSESDRFSNISKKLSQHADTVLNVANKLEISDDVKELLKRNCVRKLKIFHSFRKNL